LVRKLSIAASALTAAAVTAQAVVAVAQQLGKSREERAGLEGAVRLTVAATVAKALPAILTEVRTLGRELRRS
jgi:pyruvate/2-oxoglutarate dehydrogenase complex dihydrolipoamide acyltransferase (E2) component